MKKQVYFVSLGCPKNRVDTEVMLGLTGEAGFTIASEPEKANVIVVNTCGFIGDAKEESVDTILEMARFKEAGSCERLVVTGFTGPYTLPADVSARTDHIVHVCAGSGSVPNFSMLKFALANHPALRHTFVYSNKSWDDIIFRDELARLAAAHADRLNVVHTLTREENSAVFGPSVRKGRVNAALLRETIPQPGDCYVYVCGPGISKFDVAAAKEKGEKPPPRFLESVLADLAAIGVPNDRIKREFYG